MLFVSHEETYYSEYIVMQQALLAAGYTVDVRSTSDLQATTYMIPDGTTIEETANTLASSNYSQFTSQFLSYFGSPWNDAYNATPDSIPVNGRIQDIVNMNDYLALVVVGGVGAQAYNVDGMYDEQGLGSRMISATEVRNAAEKLNSLAVEALQQGKPVMGICHGAGIPAHWRYPIPDNTEVDSLGLSILSGSMATGFPEPETATFLEQLNISYRPNDPVVIGSPHLSLPQYLNGQHKILTIRDWYPQTIAHAALTLMNILDTYPATNDMTQNVNVLILHGGEVDPDNCDHTNRNNDIPCNYGGGVNLPADYTDLISLLEAHSDYDEYNFTVSDVNITGNGLPFDPDDLCSVFEYLNDFEVVLFYKHWSTGVTVELQNAIVTFAENGGGVVAIHHGLYNDIDPGGLNKNILVNSLFNAESAMNTWSANRTTFNLFNTNPGHFITTWGISYPETQQAPFSWNSNPLHPSANTGYSFYQRFELFDEIYNNTTFVGMPEFGREINHITPLFSNDLSPSGQCHTAGFSKVFDQNLDGVAGKLVYLQPGETIDNYQVTHAFGQTIRNAIKWSGHNASIIYPQNAWSSGTGNWTTSGNWNLGRVPLSCEEVIIPAQINPITVTIPSHGNHTIKSLRLGANVTMQMDSTTFFIIQD